VKACILNNDFQGMVKQWQDLFYGRRYSNTTMKNPNFAAMAEAFGVRGIRCEHKCDVEKTVQTMLDHKGPVVVDFYVEPNEHVYPMVPSGKGTPRDGVGNTGITVTQPRRATQTSRPFCLGEHLGREAQIIPARLLEQAQP
jgi:acetolactate synthase-1/2/3 large subunit